MPIVRTYACPDCGHFLELTLSAEQWDDPPPECPRCAERAMQQEFVPPRIVGSTATRARDLAQTIAHEDYHVADIAMDPRAGSKPKVRYKDAGPKTTSQWQAASAELMQTAIAAGRDTRQKYGSGLEVLQQNLKDGTQPDLIEMSKRRAMRVW